MHTHYKPPLWYPGTLEGAVDNQRAGLLASLLPITSTCIAMWLFESPAVNVEGVIFWAIYLPLGVLTAISSHFVLRRLPGYDFECFIIWGVACAFPFWAPVVFGLSLCLLGPAGCTAAWACSLSLVLGKRRAVQYAVVQALLSNAAMFTLPQLIGGALEDNFVGPTILFWHLTNPITLAIAAELTRRDHEHLRNTCEFCGYSRDGLHERDRCPECGRLHNPRLGG